MGEHHTPTDGDNASRERFLARLSGMPMESQYRLLQIEQTEELELLLTKATGKTKVVIQQVISNSMLEKGGRNCVCNRTVCNNTPAIHYNKTMQKYYCTPCARRLNENATHDGIPLCDWPTREQLDRNGLLLPIKQ